MRCPTTIATLLLGISLPAQNDDAVIKPVCRIHVTTTGENKLKGLLLYTSDSSVVIYPGKKKQWNNGKKFRPVEFTASRIKRITIKKNNRALKGMTLGSVVGVLPMLAGSKDGNNAGLQELTKLTVPVGGISGALLGLTQQKSFSINGSVTLFRQFQRAIR
jgi:hypothetical protein